jgi:NAD(P)H dehydrogenase (quinone)
MPPHPCRLNLSQEVPVKHAVIFSHPNADSFTASVAGAYAQAAEQLGHAVVRRDLYRMGFDPRLTTEELPRESFIPAPEIQAERALLKDVDVFALIYPLWLNAPPAMMKGYLERVFGFGFAYGGGGNSANPLLSGRKMIAFSSSGAPLQWVKDTGALGAIHTLFDAYFAQVCGLTALDHVHFGGIVPGATQDFVEARLADVVKTVNQHFRRTA